MFITLAYALSARAEKLQLCSDLFLQVLLLRLQPKSQSAALNMPKLPGSKLSVLQLI